jgi:hypothetical protein
VINCPKIVLASGHRRIFELVFRAVIKRSCWPVLISAIKKLGGTVEAYPAMLVVLCGTLVFYEPFLHRFASLRCTAAHA